MADGALVLVDAAEGPMPQTRYVLQKALQAGLRPIIVVNKIDRPDARAEEVVDEVMEVLLDLGAEEHIDDFTHVFASAKDGYATHDPTQRTGNMEPLLDLVMQQVPGPEIDADQPLRMLVTTIDWSEFVGRIAIGRLQSGEVRARQDVLLMQDDDRQTRGKVASVQVFEDLGRVEVERAVAGDVVALVGLTDIEIGDTICALDNPLPLERLRVDLPTLEMVFSVNSSPFAGRDGKYLTTRQLRERLLRETERNVALRVRQIANSESYAVRGRGIMHLSVLIETMRREGYELSVGKPHVVLRKENGQTTEPFETLTVEVPADRLGPVMELVGKRRGDMQHMAHRGQYNHVTFSIPARGLIGLRTRLLNATQGTAIMHHRFHSYQPQEGDLPRRTNGVLVSQSTGSAVAFALDGLQERAELFIKPGDEVYEGMIVGENSRCRRHGGQSR